VTPPRPCILDRLLLWLPGWLCWPLDRLTNPFRPLWCRLAGHRWQLTVRGVTADQFWCGWCHRLTARRKPVPIQLKPVTKETLR
jgi:hypothetical protein